MAAVLWLPLQLEMRWKKKKKTYLNALWSQVDRAATGRLGTPCTQSGSSRYGDQVCWQVHQVACEYP